MFGEIIKSRAVPSPAKKDEEMKMPPPMVCVSAKEIPEMKTWKPGQVYKLQFRMVSKEVDEKGGVHGDFELDARGESEVDDEEEEYED